MEIPAITDGEMHVLRVLWEDSPLPAVAIAHKLAAEVGWNKNTTYTFIKRLVDKGAVQRRNPGFLCAPLVSPEAVRLHEGQSFLARMYGGSLSMMVASFVKGKGVSPEELRSLRKLIEESGGEEDGSLV